MRSASCVHEQMLQYHGSWSPRRRIIYNKVQEIWTRFNKAKLSRLRLLGIDCTSTAPLDSFLCPKVVGLRLPVHLVLKRGDFDGGYWVAGTAGTHRFHWSIEGIAFESQRHVFEDRYLHFSITLAIFMITYDFLYLRD